MSSEPTTIALVGNPNVGKTTIFNALTGSNQQVGNFAGVTVSHKTGEMRTPHGDKLRVIDLPGCYSLSAASKDEEVAVNFLTEKIEGQKKPDLVICVVDSSALERHLQLVLQIIELKIPVVIALNMVDMAEKNGLRLDPVKMSEELDVPVIPMQADSGKGVVELKQALRSPRPAAPEPHWHVEGDAEQSRSKFIRELCATAARRPDEHQLTVADKLDHKLFLHPFFGWVVFLGIMFGVFWSIFSLSAYPMGWVETAFAAIADLVASWIPEGDFQSLMVDGVIGGLEGVVIFLPQILMLFLFIGLLESSGYMARAAYLMDGLMAKAGLSGKAFLPLFSSYACAIPGVMATRTIGSAKERLVTIFIAPWMSCAARLPVFFLIIPLLLHEEEGGSWKQALVLFGIYVVGTLTAFIVAKVLRTKLGPETDPQPFVLELPTYRKPQWGYILRHVGGRGWAFIRKAGTIILGLSILLWALSTYPKAPEGEEDAISYSAMGRMGDAIEPVVKPLGFDGRVGTAVLTSFAAREVFNSSLGVILSVEEGDDDVENRDKLRNRMKAASWPDGSPLFTPLSLISILVFFIYALQCLPTSAVVLRESGSWKWTVGQFAFMSGFAYMASLLVFQIGSLMGF